jgi:hypothetical protein
MDPGRNTIKTFRSLPSAIRSTRKFELQSTCILWRSEGRTQGRRKVDLSSIVIIIAKR